MIRFERSFTTGPFHWKVRTRHKMNTQVYTFSLREYVGTRSYYCLERGYTRIDGKRCTSILGYFTEPPVLAELLADLRLEVIGKDLAVGQSTSVYVPTAIHHSFETRFFSVSELAKGYRILVRLEDELKTILSLAHWGYYYSAHVEGQQPNRIHEFLPTAGLLGMEGSLPEPSYPASVDLPPTAEGIPGGFQRCPVCGEFNGTTRVRYLNYRQCATPPDPNDVRTVSCICTGILCSACGKNMVHRPGSSTYYAADNTVWHTPCWPANTRCEECRRGRCKVPIFSGVFSGNSVRSLAC